MAIPRAALLAILGAGLGLSAVPAPAAARAAGIDLRVSGSGHFLEKSDGTPFFFLSDTEWLLNKHSDDQVLQVLDDRKARGFTVVQVFATRNWSQTDCNGNTPFANNSITQFNSSYWNRWRWIADEAAERGLYFLLIYGEPGRKESPWSAGSNQECYDYGRLVGATFADKTNVIFCNGQDSDANGGVGADGWRAMAEGVADGVNGKNGYDGSADYSTTLQTYHGYSIYQTFQNDAWIDFYGQEVWHNNGAVYDTVRTGYNLSNPKKPIALLEGTYETEVNFATPHYVRVEAWHAYFAGGTGYGYGHYENWSQSSDVDYLDSTGARHMGVLAGFMTSISWWKFAPDPSILANGTEGSGSNRKVALRSSDGTQCCVYFPVIAAADVRMDGITVDDEVDASWFDPRDGTVQSAGRFATTEIPTMTPPAGWEDAVLVLEAVTPPAPPPAGKGLTGNYYHNPDFTSPAFSRVDASVDFDWGAGSPDPSMDADTFSVRWSGSVVPPVTGDFTFTTTSDDGVRLWVAGQLLVDNWTDHGPADDSGTISLEAGRSTRIVMEYYENGGGAVARLSWSAPGLPRETIPVECLSTGGAVAADEGSGHRRCGALGIEFLFILVAFWIFGRRQP